MISDALVAPGERALLGEEVSSSAAAWLTTGVLWLQNRPRVGGQRRCGRSGQIARTASACAGAGERGTFGESEAEKGARFGEDRAGADPRRPTRLCEDGADPRCPVGGAEDRLRPSRPDPRPMSDRSLEDARRSDRSATRRADQPLPPLTRQRRSVAARERSCGKSREGYPPLANASPDPAAVTDWQPPQFGLQTPRFDARTEFTHPTGRASAPALSVSSDPLAQRDFAVHNHRRSHQSDRASHSSRRAVLRMNAREPAPRRAASRLDRVRRPGSFRASSRSAARRRSGRRPS
jgi:hypothetical protein